jgi:hypothetical protein
MSTEFIIKTKFIIKIDKIFFRIMNKNLSESRIIVNIYSSEDKNALIGAEKYLDEEIITKFSVYLSVSELGCFRLCLVGNPGPNPELGKIRSGDYYKGTTDYIQQTFIHIKLQKFIHDYYEKLEINNDINFCNLEDNSKDNSFVKYKPIFKHINDEDRMIRLEPFSEHAFNFMCGDKKATFEKLINFSSYLEEKYTCEFINNESIFYHTVLTEEDEYTLQFYKIILTDKNTTNNNNIVLYYYIVNIQKFRSKKIPNEINQKSIYLPIFLTTEEEEGNKITKFGTFNKYILAGNYICKLFDYIKQCPNDINEGQCFGIYVLIGHNYDQIFPFNQIKNFNIITKK